MGHERERERENDSKGKLTYSRSQEGQTDRFYCFLSKGQERRAVEHFKKECFILIPGG